MTDDYGALRRRLLIAAVENVPGFAARLAEAGRTLNLLSGIYEEWRGWRPHTGADSRVLTRPVALFMIGRCAGGERAC